MLECDPFQLHVHIRSFNPTTSLSIAFHPTGIITKHGKQSIWDMAEVKMAKHELPFFIYPFLKHTSLCFSFISKEIKV